MCHELAFTGNLNYPENKRFTSGAEQTDVPAFNKNPNSNPNTILKKEVKEMLRPKIMHDLA